MDNTTVEDHPDTSDDVTAVAASAPRFGLTRPQLIKGAVTAAVILGVGLSIPYIVSDRAYMGLLLDAAILSLLALGIGFIARYLGLISLGHTAFFGGAAYAVGIATTHWGWGPSEAALFGLVAGTFIALVMGVLVVRASGMGFLMLTLALSQALYQMSVQRVSRPWTGAYDGLQVTYDSDKTFLGLPVASVMDAGLFWPVVWVALVLSIFAVWAVGRSRYGRVLEGIRENEERMRFSGYNTFRPRLTAFVISGAIASLGGVLFALNASYVSPEVLGFQKAGDALIAAIVGGLGTLLGPIVGAFLYTYALSEFNAGGNLTLFTGLALILVLMFMRGGITGVISTVTKKIRSSDSREKSKK